MAHGTNFNTNGFRRYTSASAREKYLLELAHGTSFQYKWVPPVHIWYTSGSAREKYLRKTKFRMADRITIWRIDLKALIISMTVGTVVDGQE